MINEFLAPEIPPNYNVCFQQDGATAHTAVIRTAVLRALVSSAGDFTFR
jgi:phosphoserine aminotransferase